MPWYAWASVALLIVVVIGTGFVLLNILLARDEDRRLNIDD